MKRYLILLTMLGGLLWAQEYSLDQMIEAGLKNATVMKTKAIEVDNSHAAVRSALYNALPDADVSYTQSYQRNTSSSRSNLSLSKSLALNDPSVFNYRQSKLDEKSTKLGYEQSKKQLVYDIFAAYLDILSAIKTIEIQQANVALQERIYLNTKIQCEQGRKSSYDLNQADINRINAQIDLQNAQNMLNNQRQAFFTQLMVEDKGYEFAEPILSLPIVDTLNNVITPLDKDISPLTVRLVNEQIKRDKLSLNQQKINYLPTLTASVSSESNLRDPANTTQLRKQYTISITASYSLWNIFRHGEDYHRYSNTLKLSEINLKDAKVQVKSNYYTIQRNLQYLTGSYHLQLRKKDQANENLRIAEEKYRLGLISLLDLDQAQVNDLNAKLSTNADYYTLLKTKEQLNLLLSKQIMGKW